MFAEIPQNLILITLGAFLLGWILASINARLSARYEARKRDPRDDRIRALEAEHRIAKTDAEDLRSTVIKLKSELEEASEGIEKRDNVISHQQEKMSDLQRDLKESVIKTRELRHELSDRAAENVKSEVRLREIETELSVAQASSEFIATGVLDYSVAPDGEKKESSQNEDDDESKSSDVSRTAS